MYASLLFDLKKFGPGIWYKIHTDALMCNTLASKENFVIQINTLCNDFKCKDCKPHLKAFIDNNDLKNYFNVKDGIFKWTWELHNDVNKRLGKYKPTYDEAYSYYTNTRPMLYCNTCGKK